MFGKRLNELKTADIGRLIKEEVQEGTEIEFKEALPAQRGKRDPWLEGGGRVGDFARNKILEEIIAFANAYGGVLVIGISETAEKPARAAGVVPLPECAELAERMRLQCRDCIEPQIPTLEVAGIPTEENGAGVVIIRVPKSRMAPHRHTATRECYYRHADRSEKMTMREIQDLTLNIQRGLSAIEAKFLDRRHNFGDTFHARFAGPVPGFGIRATLLPLDQFNIERVHGRDEFVPPLQSFQGWFGDEGPSELFVPAHGGIGKPILRGTRFVGADSNCEFVREVHCDGLVEYSLISAREKGDGDLLFPAWVMGLVANAICAAEKVRLAAGVPDVEYGFEFELCASGGRMPIAGYGNYPIRSFESLPEGQTIFPRYSLGSTSEFQQITAMLEQDIWDACGYTSRGHDKPLQIDFAAALTDLGLISAE